jgi:hypothetical protein
VVVRGWNSEIPARHDDLYRFGPLESNTLCHLVVVLCGDRSAPEEGVDDVPLRGAPGRLILAGAPWVTSWFPSFLLGYNMESLS